MITRDGRRREGVPVDPVVITALKTVFAIEITPLITGLGVSGIAVALAVQNILGDLLAALAIVFDKPFDVGDTIGVDQITGHGRAHRAQDDADPQHPRASRSSSATAIC